MSSLLLRRYFPYEDENNHKLVREIGNVTKGFEITVQFAVKPEVVDGTTDIFVFVFALPYLHHIVGAMT